MSVTTDSLCLEPEVGKKVAGKLERSLLWLVVSVPLFAPLLAIALVWGRWVNGRDLALLAAMYFVCALGITAGYHRMLTHRSFRAHPAVRFVLLAFGVMSGMGPPIQWAVTHIQHHAHPDDDGDPHSPWAWIDRARRVRGTGFRRMLWAHFLWIVYGPHIETTEYGRELLSDPQVRFMSRWPIVVGWTAIGFVIPYLVGGWEGLFWGGLVRIGLTSHVTWSINSVSHVYGRRMFETPDCSRNNWLFGILALGEGWHNNHHAFPRSAFHGLRWWQVDVTGYVIRVMEWLGLAKQVWRIPETTLAARMLRRRERAPQY